MKTFLDWSAYKDSGMGDAYADIPKHGGDFAKAVAVCINSGQCETQNKQVMCPSYKVSENPNLSTGGRVRLLKAALGEEDWQQALMNPELAKAMDLCISCKGCKRECDNNVDMALIKAEYQAWRAQNEGLSLRSKLFAYTPAWLYRYPWLRPLIQLRNSNALLKIATEKWLGISRKVSLPEPAATPFSAKSSTQTLNQGDSRSDSPGSEALPEVTLFLDTFSRYFEPQIAEAAEAVLSAAGYVVHIAESHHIEKEPGRPICCGRTYLAQGLIDQARYEVSRMADVLTPHVEAGRVIVGLEASCVLGLRDDAQALGLGEALEKLSKNVFLFEEFLAKEIMAKRFKLPFAKQETEILVHGHCHQKAVGAVKAVRRVLKQIPDQPFSMIDSGCCGMAGTFGLEAEHQELSEAMANDGLMPTLKLNPNATVVANGFSCRQQMRAQGDSRAQHLAVVLRTLI